MSKLTEMSFKRTDYSSYEKKSGPFSFDVAYEDDGEMLVRCDGVLHSIFVNIENTDDMIEAINFFEKLSEKMKQ